jgi:two-component system phosphate regulon response regulator PhoB
MPTVLIVDQDAHVRRLMKEVLERAGYQVSEAGNAQEAAEQLFLETPEAIVLDCLLGGPGLGLDLLRELRAAPLTAEIPVLVTTGIPEPNIDFRMRNCGASAFLLKPFSPRELLQAVALALEVGAPQPASQHRYASL